METNERRVNRANEKRELGKGRKMREKKMILKKGKKERKGNER